VAAGRRELGSHKPHAESTCNGQVARRQIFEFLLITINFILFSLKEPCTINFVKSVYDVTWSRRNRFSIIQLCDTWVQRSVAFSGRQSFRTFGSSLIARVAFFF
jgi:hypothetical protein